MTTIAIVGIGYWGKNLLRIFSEQSTVATCVHTGSESNRKWVKDRYPSIKLTTDFCKVLDNPDIDAVVVATPIDTHFKLVKKALNANKDVFVEKPLTTSPQRSNKLRLLAEENDCILFVGYIYQYHPCMIPVIQKSQEEKLSFGKFTWHKYGGFKQNILFDLAVHAISIIDSVIGIDQSNRNISNIDIPVNRKNELAFCVHFITKNQFFVEIDRESPVKEKSAKFVFQDGTRYFWTENKLFLKDKQKDTYETLFRRDKEPLLVECNNFLAAIEDSEPYPSDGSQSVLIDTLIEKIRNL